MRMTKASIAIAVAAGLLLLSAPAAFGANQELLFQGGGEPFSGDPPVGMTMAGPSFEEPKRLLGFSAQTEWGAECDHEPYEFNAPVSLEPKSAKTKRNDQGDLYFSWSYVAKSSRGSILYDYYVIAGQHRRDPHWWIGKFRVRLAEAGIESGYCRLAGADEDGFVHFKAKFFKACDRKCKSPFSSETGSSFVNKTVPRRSRSQLMGSKNV